MNHIFILFVIYLSGFLIFNIEVNQINFFNFNLAYAMGSANTDQIPNSQPRKPNKAKKAKRPKKANQAQPQKKPSTEESRLRERLDKVSQIRQQLIQKEKSVNSLISEYHNNINDLKAEVGNISAQNRYQGYNEAIKNKQIRYDIRLIQERTAYIEKLQQVRDRINDGKQEMVFLERKFSGDLKMVSVLGKEEVNKIIKNLNVAITEYGPLTKKSAINISDIKKISGEQIYSDILSNPVPHKK